MHIEIIERTETRIVGLKVETLLRDTKEQHIIPKLQQRFNEVVKEVPGAVNLPTTYGVFIDPQDYNPDTDLFTWIAGVECEFENELIEDMVSYVIPAGTYAVFHYEGNIDNAGSAYDQLYNWINESKYKQKGSYGFELYATIHSSLERRTSNFILHFPIEMK
ncbi:GyrI-like domain-containing protein [Paenibacillus amylolyticus]|uniref:GyrI-like domain-containing protein n=1 Tax=Paenibacillus amylolyticus TaxID=1451 RepID=UPI003D953AB6